MPRPAHSPNVFEHYSRPLAPELLVVGYDRHEASIRALGPHAHARAYEVCLITAGSVEWWVGREVHQVRGGQWFITRPGELHGGIDSMMHRCELYFFQMALPRRGVIAGLAPAQSRSLARGFGQLQRRRFSAGGQAQPLFKALLDEHRTPGLESAILARALVHQLLVQVLRDHAAAQDAEPAPSPTVAEAMRWIEQRANEAFHVGDVARAVGLSVNHFQTRFRREVGLTPADYRTRLRIARAQDLLRGGDAPVTRIAMALGFESSQYFATTFRRIVGLTPRVYRERWQTAGQGAGGAADENLGNQVR